MNFVSRRPRFDRETYNLSFSFRAESHLKLRLARANVYIKSRPGSPSSSLFSLPFFPSFLLSLFSACRPLSLPESPNSVQRLDSAELITGTSHTKLRSQFHLTRNAYFYRANGAPTRCPDFSFFLAIHTHTRARAHTHTYAREERNETAEAGENRAARKLHRL